MMSIVSTRCYIMYFVVTYFVLTFDIIAGVKGDNSDSVDDEFRVVMLSDKHGVRGYGQFGDTNTMAFLGVPYAAPPTGERRFARPEPMAAWEGLKEALALPPSCPQSDGFVQEMDEDCLYLNLFTPDLEGARPVMVWIHGGGWHTGSGSLFDFSRYAEKGVVVVSINYRLNVLGFGSMDDDVMPGNFGMLDQVEALKWVQRNIHKFGGDPNQVTTFGNSAGSTSAFLHVLSPLSVGLFHRSIMISGSTFSLWGVERKKALLSNKDATARIAKGVGCTDTSNSTSLIHCMRKVEVKAIIKEVTQLRDDTNTMFIFNPRVENTFGFLPDYPEVLLKAGKFQNIDTISGFTSSESAMSLFYKFQGLTQVSVPEFKEGLLNIFSWCSFKEEDEIVEHMTDFFLKNVSDPQDGISMEIMVHSADELFNIPILIQLRKVLRHQKTPRTHRLYQFDFKAHYIQTIYKVPRHFGVPHSMERGVMMYSTSNSPMFTGSYSTSLAFNPEEKQMADQVQNLWTNFAKSGNPDDGDNHWLPYTLNQPIIAHLDSKLHFNVYTKSLERDMYWQFIEFISKSDVPALLPVGIIGSVAGLLIAILFYRFCMLT